MFWLTRHEETNEKTYCRYVKELPLSIEAVEGMKGLAFSFFANRPLSAMLN